MHKLIWLFLIFSFQTALAQDLSRDLEFIETQNTQAMPFNFPVYVDLAGNLSLIAKDPNVSTSLSPLGHVAYKTTKSLYIKPVQQSEFSLNHQMSGLGWIEVKRKRWEIGAGLSAIISQNFPVGLAPYKGARQVMIRHKASQDEETANPRLPDELEETREWRVGDNGSFQRYGGVQIYAGAKISALNIITVGLTIQNLFSVVVDKVSENKIKLSITEENLNKRRLQTGVAVANAKLNFFNGKRLTTHFILNLDDPHHHELYKDGIKGKLTSLQKGLPEDAQQMSWKGSERMGYIGIPGVAGKHFQRSEYEMEFDGEEEVIDIKSRKSSGWFVPLRNHSKLVYQTEDAIILFWFSEMNKTDDDVFSRKFLIPGKLMGAKGFATPIPAGTKMGSTLSQMGMSFTREELEAVTPAMLEEILGRFKQRCEEMSLECAREKKFRKIAKTLSGFMNKKWEQIRDKLGFLMIEEPALINSYVRTIKAKKKVYFKFLNQKYQSTEGAAAIE